MSDRTRPSTLRRTRTLVRGALGTVRPRRAARGARTNSAMPEAMDVTIDLASVCDTSDPVGWLMRGTRPPRPARCPRERRRARVGDSVAATSRPIDPATDDLLAALSGTEPYTEAGISETLEPPIDSEAAHPNGRSRSTVPARTHRTRDRWRRCALRGRIAPTPARGRRRCSIAASSAARQRHRAPSVAQPARTRSPGHRPAHQRASRDRQVDVHRRGRPAGIAPESPVDRRAARLRSRRTRHPGSSGPDDGDQPPDRTGARTEDAAALRSARLARRGHGRRRRPEREGRRQARRIPDELTRVASERRCARAAGRSCSILDTVEVLRGRGETHPAATVRDARRAVRARAADRCRSSRPESGEPLDRVPERIGDRIELGGLDDDSADGLLGGLGVEPALYPPHPRSVGRHPARAPARRSRCAGVGCRRPRRCHRAARAGGDLPLPVSCSRASATETLRRLRSPASSCAGSTPT